MIKSEKKMTKVLLDYYINNEIKKRKKKEDKRRKISEIKLRDESCNYVFLNIL